MFEAGDLVKLREEFFASVAKYGFEDYNEKNFRNKPLLVTRIERERNNSSGFLITVFYDGRVDIFDGAWLEKIC